MDKNHFMYTKDVCEKKLDCLIMMVEEIEVTFETNSSFEERNYSDWSKKEGA